MKKEIIFLVASCTFAVAAACGDDTTTNNGGTADATADAAKEASGSSSGTSGSSSGKSSSSGSSSGGMEAGGGVACVPSLGMMCSGSAMICCGNMATMSTVCQAKSMPCSGGTNQLCAMSSDCVDPGRTCQMTAVGPIMLGVCLPGDGGTSSDGGDSGGSSSGGGDSGGSSSSGGGDSGGDTGSDAPSDTGGG